jgi:GntR family transcriptional regulator
MTTRLHAATTAEPLVSRFLLKRNSALPKHVRLRSALIEVIEAGELPLGARLPGERDLSGLLGISLGTTQKALARLVTEGFLVRRHGHGTFVANGRRPVGGSWHYRFLAPDGQGELPVYTVILERSIDTDAGPWSEALGPDPKGYVRLERRADIGNLFQCHGEIWLPASRFGRLMRFSERRLNDVNLKLLLESEFAAPTVEATGAAWVRKIPARAARTIRVAPGTWGLEVHILTLGIGRQPLSFQRMTVPPTDCALKLDFPGPSASGALPASTGAQS